MQEEENIDKTLPLEIKQQEEEITTLGDLKLQEKLGEGGMACVYKAYHKMLGVHRAVKVLLPRYARDEEFTKRFLRESRLAVKLQHPNIVTIHNVAKDGDKYYIDMEYIDGYNLAQIKRKDNTIPICISLIIVSQIVKALAYTHNKRFEYHGEIHKGIIHRDIKPSNILISKEGEVKLSDFGIAKVKDIREDTITTTRDVLIGSLPYMSKEQLEGRPLDVRTDIYSLGVVLYELLTGDNPFGRKPITEVIRRITNGKFTTPQKLAPQIPDEVERIILKAMSKEPHHRYQRIEDMGQDIDKFLKNLKLKEKDYSQELSKYLKDKEGYKEPITPEREKVPVINIVMAIAVITFLSILGLYIFQKNKASVVISISNIPKPIKIIFDNKEYSLNKTQQICILKNIPKGKHIIRIIKDNNILKEEEIEIDKNIEYLRY